MSFSKDVKEELLALLPKSRHCMVAELAGIFLMHGANISDEALSRKVFTLLNKTLNIGKDVDALSEEMCNQIKQMIKLSDDEMHIDELVLQQTCCKRAFIRGAFLVGGSISDPNKGYHFEIVCSDEAQAKQIAKNMNVFDVNARIVGRNSKFVVYLKEGAQIVEILRVMEAARSVMELENIRVVKEVRGTINRKVNCETANISKTVSASVKQLEDIRLVQKRLGFCRLSPGLAQMAELRLAYPEATLKELGMMSDPPLGKSGVNHRLRRLSIIAGDLRRDEEPDSNSGSSADGDLQTSSGKIL